jgi:hypothetical protein
MARSVNPHHGWGPIGSEEAGGPSGPKSSLGVPGCGGPAPHPRLQGPPGALADLSNCFTMGSRQSIMLATATARAFSPARRPREPATESPPHPCWGALSLSSEIDPILGRRRGSHQDTYVSAHCRSDAPWRTTRPHPRPSPYEMPPPMQPGDSAWASATRGPPAGDSQNAVCSSCRSRGKPIELQSSLRARAPVEGPHSPRW